jgi:ribosome recycling factor
MDVISTENSRSSAYTVPEFALTLEHLGGRAMAVKKAKKTAKKAKKAAKKVKRTAKKTVERMSKKLQEALQEARKLPHELQERLVEEIQRIPSVRELIDKAKNELLLKAKKATPKGS